ncbi:MAG: DMT family transporter [Melioribacteraceae bacterium]
MFLALLVTFLWSTSFIIIKWGLRDIPPLTYAGLRYVLAFLCLLPFALTKKRIAEIKSLDKKNWIQLALLGFLFYTFTQGTQFIGLSLLPAVTVSLLLNFTPIIVAIMGIFLLSEKPTILQWSGTFLFIVGILVYFYPVNLPPGRALGIAVMSIGVLANAASSILGRRINRTGKFDPVTVTLISMGIGSIVMLITGITFQGLPSISFTNLLFLIWLAVVNTAFAFTIWNLTLRNLTAMESSIINGTMLIQIALLAWLFLGESITIGEGIGMFIAFIGAVIVQIRRKN